jgi:hypothetical protein
MKLLENNFVELSDAVAEAVVTQTSVRIAPHDFYKYPARFTPLFPREIIRHFSQVGDTIIDPFCGSGTTLVEAVSQARNGIGFDISSLAAFLSRVKTTPLSQHDTNELFEWLKMMERLKPSLTSLPPCSEREYYQNNAPASSVQFFNAVIEQTSLLRKERQRKFIRMMLLAVGQWALDCKTFEPGWSELKEYFLGYAKESITRYYTFITEVAKDLEIPRCKLASRRRVINRACEDSGLDKRIPKGWLPAKLVVTSPPYPGVHVLYHRWQVKGRRETPLPFWLAATRDGAGESHYSMGPRSQPELTTYFRRLETSFTSVRKLLAADALVFQLVAFSKPDWQLPLYLEKMSLAGFKELLPACELKYLSKDGRIWRNVPGRRWYASNQKRTAANQEVLLIHTPSETLKDATCRGSNVFR